MARFSSALWFRALALCIALCFGGGYVWKRQKKVAPSPSPEPAQVESGIFRITPAEGETFDLMSSSKSGRIFGEASKDEAEDARSEELVVLPSSKLGLLPPPEGEPDPTEESSKDNKRKRLLPGSKSIGGVLEGEDFTWSEDMDRALEKRETGVEQKSQEP